jgi:hypothetical protein
MAKVPCPDDSEFLQSATRILGARFRNSKSCLVLAPLYSES